MDINNKSNKKILFSNRLLRISSEILMAYPIKASCFISAPNISYTTLEEFQNFRQESKLEISPRSLII